MDFPDNERIAETGSSSSRSTAPKKSKSSSNNASHGFMFEVKLLTLFLIRATAAGYRFQLTTNAEKLGGKLDDLIFKYQVDDDTTTGEHWRYRYLQAKHKEDEGKRIQASQLLGENGDFSLGKYFRSYCKIIARGEDVYDCIICTNINFNVTDLERNAIEMVAIDEQDDILFFGSNLPNGKTPARYRLKITDELREKMRKSSNIENLAENLRNCGTFNRQDSSKGTRDLRNEAFESYHVALVKEKVIDLKTKRFHNDFIVNAEGLSDGASQLRELFSTSAENGDWESWKFNLNHTFGKANPK